MSRIGRIFNIKYTPYLEEIEIDELTSKVKLIENFSDDVHLSIIKVDGELILNYYSEEMEFNLPIRKAKDLIETMNSLSVNAKVFEFNLKRFDISCIPTNRLISIADMIETHLNRNKLSWKQHLKLAFYDFFGIEK